MILGKLGLSPIKSLESWTQTVSKKIETPLCWEMFWDGARKGGDVKYKRKI